MKSELSKAREHEADLIQQNSNLEKEQYRLKAISKADEIKQELESKIEDLRLDHQDKMIEVQNYHIKDEEFGKIETDWNQILQDCSKVVTLSSKVKTNLDIKKSTMMESEKSHENLETIESQLFEIQKIIQTLKNDIAISKQKWDKNKSARESDLLDYNQKLKTLFKTTTEEDMINNELDSKYV